MTKGKAEWRTENDMDGAPQHVEYVQQFCEILARVFALVPPAIQFSVHVSFLMTALVGNTPNPKQAWKELRGVIDEEMPRALAALNRQKN